MWYNIFVFLSFLQSVIGFTLMSSSAMNFREPVRRRVITGLAVMVFGISFLSYTLFTQGINSVDSFAIFVILAIELSWFLICSDDRFFVSFFSFLTFVNIYISISYISDNLAIHTEGSAFVVERILIRALIYIFILPMLFKLVRPRFRRLVETLDREWRSSVLVPFMFLMMQIMVLYYPSPYWQRDDGSWYRIIIVTVYMLFLSVYYLLYIQASAIVEKYALEKRQLLMSQQEKLWESELMRQRESAELAFRQRHDMHHHNAVIMGLIQSRDIESIKEYMTKFDSALNAQNIRSYCLNPIANSIINIYADRAAQENIKTAFDLNVPEVIGIDIIDLTCVIGNALENALEGCMRLPEGDEKEINVTIKYFDNRLRIKVENTCISEIVFKGELPVTQKNGGGTGTKSIIYTAERYDGTAGFSVVNGRFTTQVVLNAD